jgi:hypothetical protein
MAIMIKYVTRSGKAIAAGGPYPAYQSKNLQSVVTYKVRPIFVYDPWNQNRLHKYVTELAAAETVWKIISKL